MHDQPYTGYLIAANGMVGQSGGQSDGLKSKEKQGNDREHMHARKTACIKSITDTSLLRTMAQLPTSHAKESDAHKQQQAIAISATAASAPVGLPVHDRVQCAQSSFALIMP
jgi:hypothetical protein